MKPEEAIKIIEVAKAECEWNAPLEYQEAFEAAIDALEKQIPKKTLDPEPRTWHFSTTSDNCGNCGMELADHMWELLPMVWSKNRRRVMTLEEAIKHCEEVAEVQEEN